MVFEWDEDKAGANLKKHGISFEEAVEAFGDENAIELFDELNSDAEVRYQIIALSPIRLLFVAYTLRDEEAIRLISARRASHNEIKTYNKFNGK